MKALDNRDKYVDNTNLKGWMVTIMKHIFFNNYRKDIHSKIKIENIDNIYLIELYHNLCSEASDSRCIMAEIKQIINSFSSTYTQPFNLYVLGFKYAEVAEKLDIPEGTVKSRIYCIKQKLQILLKDYR